MKWVGLPRGVDGQQHAPGRAGVPDPRASGLVHVRLVPARDRAIVAKFLIREPFKGVEAVAEGELEGLQALRTGYGSLIADADALGHEFRSTRSWSMETPC